MKTPSIKYLRNKADTLFQKKIVSENPYCLICGKPTACGHHFIPKSLSARLRYDENNMIPICMGCHLKIHRSGDPSVVRTILQKNGEEWANDLQKRRREPVRINKGYLKGIIEGLK